MNAATRAVIERLVEALVAMQTEARARNCGLKICADAIAEARKLLEGDALAQPADEDAWQREMFSLINELHSAGLDGSRGRCRDAVLALNENIRDRPAREGFVSVPVEPPIEEVEAIIACLEDDAAMLRDEKSDCEIAANMVQAVALIRLLLAIPAADVDLIAAAKGGGK